MAPTRRRRDGFMRLPTDIHMKILALLPWPDLLKMTCVCSETKRLASDDELWRQRYWEVLGEVGMAGAGEGERSWKDMFGACMRRKKMMEREMARRRFDGPGWPLTPRPHPQPVVIAYETNEEYDEADDRPFKPPSDVPTYNVTYDEDERDADDDDEWFFRRAVRGYDPAYEETRPYETRLFEEQLVHDWPYPSLF